jgi:hypothetical protein
VSLHQVDEEHVVTLTNPTGPAMESARRPTRLDDFPYELLRRVFEIGSELKYPKNKREMFSRPGERRRKSFPELVRAVCGHWRDVVDRHDDEFWIMFLPLELGERRGLPVSNAQFIESTSSFFSSMEHSSNCDLVLAFSMVSPGREYQGDVWVSNYAHFLHCLQRSMGSPKYTTQMSVIQISVNDIKIAREGLRLIRAVPSAPRLKTLIFGSMEDPDMSHYLLPFENVWSGSKPSIDFSGPTKNGPTSASKSSFCLETLQIPSTYWLKPLGISDNFLHLIVLPWFPFSSSSIQGLSNLASLELTMEYPSEGDSEFSGHRREYRAEDVMYGTSFPFLKRLSIRSVFSFAFTFLTRNSFPSLKSARIIVSEHPNPPVPYGNRLRSEDVDVRLDISTEEPFSAIFPHLTELSIHFPSMFIGLNIYQLFRGSPLSFLELRWRADPHTIPSDSTGKDPGFKNCQCEDVLPGWQFKLQTLICNIPYSAIAMLIAVIRSLDLADLEALEMSIPDFPKGDPNIMMFHTGEGERTEKPSQAATRLEELLTAMESLDI